MRKILFWFGMLLLAALPVAYGIQIYVTQDLPLVEPWKWALLFVAVVLTYFARSRDDVLKHHLV